MNVFLSEYIHKESYEHLKEKVNIVTDYNQLEIVDGIITRNITIDKEMMDKMPRLKVIGIHGSGVDDVDIKEAHKRKIKVFHVPSQNSVSVAELNIANMLLLSRNILNAHQGYIHQTITQTAPIELTGDELMGKTVGIIGFGTIGKLTAKRLKGFDMNIVAYSRSLTLQIALNYEVDIVSSLEELCTISDYIILSLPLTKKTYHLIDKQVLSLMKPSAYLINTTRGEIIDEEALYECLKNKRIKGAALDVLTKEPKYSKLFELDNIIVTPHIGANTGDALKRVGNLCVKQMLLALDNKKIPYEVHVE